MKGSKLAGVLVASAIVGLSLGDALTGHGIKGNKNLNPIVVGDGSSTSNSSSSSSSSSSSGSGSSGSGSSSSSTNSDNSSDDNKPKLQHHNTKNYCLITVYGNDGKPTENHPGNFYSCIPGDGPCTPACVAL